MRLSIIRKLHELILMRGKYDTHGEKPRYNRRDGGINTRLKSFDAKRRVNYKKTKTV